ncbi:hypothetical protein KO361_01195 [Candidatus Woesearchaeota archaeon]|nr:hypothetical protein [Candidatus Woesearchaeota archaeon]
MKKKLTILLILAMSLMLIACGPKEQDQNGLTDDLNLSIIDEITEPKPIDPIDASKAAYTLRAVEGELVRIPVQAQDPDGGEVKITFEKPFNQEGLWLTRIGDEGQYLVKVSVTDGLLTTSEHVLIIIDRANRPPVVECPEKIVVQETETVKINCNIYDEDGDPVIVSYEGWMRSSTRDTDYGDEGNYSVLVRARDAENEVTKSMQIIVEKKNRPPVIETINELRVIETETIRVQPKVTDPDGDDITLSFSEPLSADGSWTPDFGDRGTYEVIITASDGKEETTETFKLVVERRNRAPVIKPIETITVQESETVKINVQAYDPDGDDIIISFSGWMNSSEYTTTYDDAHPLGCDEPGCTATYFVTVTASDGVLETNEVVEVRVKDKNRPPEIVFG